MHNTIYDKCFLTFTKLTTRLLIDTVCLNNKEKKLSLQIK